MSNNKYEVRRLDHGSQQLWSQFVTHEQLPYSYTLLWKEMLEQVLDADEYYWYVVDRSKECVVAILPSFMKDGSVGKVVNSLPYTQSVGGWVIARNVVAEDKSMLLEVAQSFISNFSQEHNISFWSEVYTGSNTEALFEIGQIETRSRTFELLSLGEPLEFRKGLKWNIKQGAKFALEAFQAKSIAEIHECYKVYADAMTTMGVKPHEWGVFNYLLNSDRESFLEVYGSKLGSEIVGVVILMVYNGRVSYYASGCSPKGRKAQAISWLCREVIEIMIERGLDVWDWMPSPNEKVKEYKASWGGGVEEHVVRTYCFREPKGICDSSILLSEYEGFFVVPFDCL